MGRRWLYIPDLFPHTVVFFFWKNDRRAPGRSWRIRDYSEGVKREYGPTDFDLTHSQILAKANWEDLAPTIEINDPSWVKETRRLNLERNIGPRQVQAPPSPMATSSNDGTPAAGIPMLDESALRRLRSGKALERMLTSPNSEDWVSWTVFRTLERKASWWPSLIRIANLEGLDAREVPSLEFWGEFPSPGSYERASRRRMEASANPEIQARARDLKPVEGYTEVDIMLDGRQVLWFIEAKLHSDLSCRTTYDSTRNQLVRNIDVLLEQARGRRSIMSLMVLDRLPGRYHSQLLAHYHHNPEALYALLPHRPRAEVESVLRDLRVLLWSDVLPLLGSFEPAAVREELWRRCVSPT